MVDGGFIGWVEFLKNIGIFEFYLPFVILFALLFGLLEKSKIFGEKGRRANIIISLAAAFFIMAYTPVGLTLTQFFASFFTQTAVALVAILVIVMIVYLLVPITGEQKFPGAAKYIAFFAVLLTLGMFISSGGLAFLGFKEVGLEIPAIGLSPQDILIIVLIAITALVIYWMTKGEGAPSAKVGP
ncbi:MAG: hypothetical protein QMD12_03335 [Candidatus Aenigmarchaeota archaeon]|nr:hypothetical protein [Candidatus Aenigmarchaeota archaeon]